MVRFILRLLCWGMVMGASGCVQEYLPEVVEAANNYLVVDGFINGSGVTTIRLARSIKLGAPSSFPPEAKATVVIEGKSGLRYSLSETASAGEYTSVSQELPAGQQYRLRIRTSQGRDYASDYVPLKATPDIDNFEGRPTPNGLQLYISAHDESNQTQYYRWQYSETWEFTSGHWSHWRFSKGTPDRRPYFRRAEDIYHCWRTEVSTAIKTASTVRLSQDVVRNQRLLFIPSSSGRLQSKYSILVRQYALSQEEFDYWEAVKKNTENIGTLFDPLPSQIQGNVHCLSDEQEPVLGFVGATTEVSQRIFIDRLKLPNDWRPINEGYEKCEGTGVIIHDSIFKGINMYEEFADTTYRTPLTEVTTPDGRIIGFNYQLTPCVDCRLRGTNVKPSFWP
ncbi:DUF4249 domain-containing protein [Hymenobacter seoulensis]